MADLEVDLSRDSPHAIDVANAFRADGSFDVVLDNHGAALHVHVHADDDLSRAVDIPTTNHFVEEGTVRRVSVGVDETVLPAEGHLKIVTGYGSETEYVNVTIEEPDDGPSVAVDERLGRPKPTTEEPSLRPEHLPLIGLALVALLIAAIAAALLGDTVVLVGTLVVLLGIAVAVGLVAQ